MISKCQKPFALDIPFNGWKNIVANIGMKPFSAKQIPNWMYAKDVLDPELMTNLTLDGRNKLKEMFSWELPKISKKQISKDGTIKIAIELFDGHNIESVIIPGDANERITVCVSSQVGCKLQCGFCRTADMGFVRNLTIGEILSQIVHLKRLSEQPITNIVFMGMGEPLLNPENVKEAVSYLTEDSCFNFAKRRITISTSGIATEIRHFNDIYNVKLAISLNSAIHEKRLKLMPIERKYPLSDLIKECSAYCKESRHRVTFEYILLDGVNDQDDDLNAFVRLASQLPCKINLIQFNQFEGCPYKPSPEKTVKKWWEELYKKGIQTNTRKSRGQDILAACGLLAGNSQSGKSRQ